MPISVLGIQPRYFVRPNNTDWRHNFFLEKSFTERSASHGSRVFFSLRRSLTACIAMNARHLRRQLGGRIPIVGPNLRQVSYFVKMLRSDRRTNFDVLYSYGCYPLNTDRPIVWHTGPTDVELLSGHGVSSKEIEREQDSKATCADHAKLIAVSSDQALLDFDKQFPGHRNKIIVLPFVIPNVIEVSELDISAKHSEKLLNILFVGREAKRKGLDLVLAAFERLNGRSKRPLTLTIVSDLSGGHIHIPSSPNVIWHRCLDHAAVQQLMRSAHILAMPSREESYGLVYLEAMAAGAVPIAPAREPQISLLAGGRCGVLCDVSVEGVFDALEALVSNDQTRQKLATNGARKYNSSFSKDGVMTRYENAFIRAAS